MNQIFLQSLEIMWKGMASIFVVMIILTICVFVITKLFQDKPEKESDTIEAKNNTDTINK